MRIRLLFVAVCVALWPILGATGALAQEKEQKEEKQENQAWVKPPVIPHQVEKRETCLMCHAASGGMANVPSVPANHEGRTNDMCLWCHAKDAAVQTTTPPAIPHKLEGRGACLMCHTPGAMANVPDTPKDHAGRKNEDCTLCHKPKAEGS